MKHCMLPFCPQDIKGALLKTLDFNSALVQGTLPEPIYLELPPGYSSQSKSDTVYKVSKSLYGNVRATKLWYTHLRSVLLEKLHSTISKIDSCLFYRRNLIFIFYVDAGITVSKDSLLITSFIADLRSSGLELNVKADYAGYLGFDMKHNQEGTLLLSQTGLINSIISDLGLSDSPRSKPTPATEILSHYKSSPPIDSSFKYHSVLGKIMYLSSNTRCDLSIANHQCSRFSIDPRVSHATAFKIIGRYLLGTRNKGTIFRPTEYRSLHCYADVDFVGMFSSMNPEDPKSVNSRTGFVILLGTTAIAWSTKLQTEIALPTMEYMALSQSLCVLLPLRQVLQEITKALQLTPTPKKSIHTTIFEDNQACFKLATSNPPHMTS
jgi:hypothetical protein